MFKPIASCLQMTSSMQLKTISFFVFRCLTVTLFHLSAGSLCVQLRLRLWRTNYGLKPSRRSVDGHDGHES